MIVVGSGAIGVEFGYFYNSMGTKVTIVEFLPRIVPVEDEEISKELEKNFKKNGIDIMTNSEVTTVDTSGAWCKSNSENARWRNNIGSRYSIKCSWCFSKY